MNLFSTPLINLALAIIISWALFAIFCGLIVEAFAQIKGERGRFMKDQLLDQLYDSPNGVNWGTFLYMNGNIDLLSKDPSKPTNDINSRLFAETLIEVVANAQIVKMAKGDLNKSATYYNKTLANFKRATQVLKPSKVMSVLTQALKSAELQSLQSKNDNDSEVYNKLIGNIERWYIEMTERFSLWYKKKTKKTLFVTGFILALILNVDSIQLFQSYNHNPASTEAVIRYYEESIQNSTNDSSQHARTLNEFKKDIDNLKNAATLPIGYDASVFHCAKSSVSFWLWKIIGILTSAFAASFGGPFWYDLLKKIYTKKTA